jgi:hypothetical protein
MFPKPGKRPKQKRVRERDEKYLRWIHGFPCIVPGCDKWPVHAHHVNKKSRLGSDKTCLPICAQHHIGGIHTAGEKTCAAKWKVDFELLVKQFNNSFERGEVGPFDNLVPNGVKSS